MSMVSERPSYDEPDRDVFREWLRKEIEEVRGLVFEQALEHMPGIGKAFETGNPQDLDAVLWAAWYKHESDSVNPAAPYTGSPAAPPQKKVGPRGGRYTDARTKDGRPYRRYF